jgi:hypothetical protein
MKGATHQATRVASTTAHATMAASTAQAAVPQPKSNLSFHVPSTFCQSCSSAGHAPEMKLIATALLAAAAFAAADPNAKITNLPGWDDASFDMYSGYINVSDCQIS